MDKEKFSDWIDWLKKFGETSSKNLIMILFYCGIGPLIFSSVAFGNTIYLTNTYSKRIFHYENGRQWQSFTEVNNLPLGVFLGIAYFVLGLVIWKVICELLMMVFRCLEGNRDKKEIT